MPAHSIAATRRGHLFWLGLYLLLDLSWIRFDQFAYWHDAFAYGAVLRGIGCAPEQYRIGGVFAAQGLMSLLHVHSLSAGFIVIDFLSAVLLSVLLYALLVRELATVAAPLHSAAKALLGLWMLFFLYGTYAYARVETLPSCVCVAFFLWLTGKLAASRPAHASLAAFGLMLLAFAQGWVRADVAFTLGVALGLAALLPSTRPRRTAALCAGALAAVLSGGALLYLMKVRYPAAHYCGSVIEWRANLTLLHNYLGLLTVLPPLLVGVVTLWRRFATGTLANRTALLAAVLYLALWSTFGNWSEARIIAPFALALMPAAATAIACFTSAQTAG